MTNYKLTILSSFTHAVWKGEYVSFAEGDDLLEEIFRYFNRVDPEDNERLERRGYRLPSMTAGDVLAIIHPDKHPQLFVVDSCGFAEAWPGIGLRANTTKEGQK